ncbi:MAG: MarC family protein [Spirochaetales bacterium]|nr:MarC family protein [Spirochaetales bacterium]
MKIFWLNFVPLFIAVDAIGVLPIFISLTDGFEQKQIVKITVQSFFTALVVSLLFLLFGQFIFHYLGISTYDFMIAGGVILFILSIRDILISGKKQRFVDPGSLGAVPIGVPLIVGPAVLTTSLILINEHGLLFPLIAMVVNIIIACVIFLCSPALMKVLGKTGSKTISKIASLILAALAVMMIRKGITALLS